MERKRITGRFIAFLAIALLSAVPVWAQGMKESMKQMEGMEPAKGMKPMARMGGMKMPANAPTVSYDPKRTLALDETVCKFAIDSVPLYRV